MYTGFNLKTTEFHECALIGVCTVIRSNTVFNKNVIRISPWKDNVVQIYLSIIQFKNLIRM